MKVRLQRVLEDLRSSYWFLPCLMTIAAILLVVLSHDFERRFGIDDVPGLGWLFAIGAPGARAVLGTVATSAIGTASVVFSISIVALSLTSSQFGPRLLKNFMRQQFTQLTLGTFMATFIFTLFALATVPESSAAGPVPHLAVLIALGFGLVSFLFLIFYVQHIVAFIQAPKVIEDVSSQLMQRLQGLPEREEGDDVCGMPEGVGAFPDEEDPGDALRVTARNGGYLQAVDVDSLLGLAAGRDLYVRLVLRAGQFAMPGQLLALVGGDAGDDADAVCDTVRAACVFGIERTVTQDMEFSIDQLVEVGVRALSPGINDPFTAINCVDQLGAALAVLAGRRLESGLHADDGGTVRLCIETHSYAGMLDSAFNQLRQHAAGDAAVTIRMLEIVHDLAGRDLPASFRDSLLSHARLLYATKDELAHPSDREDAESRFERIREVLGEAI